MFVYTSAMENYTDYVLEIQVINTCEPSEYNFYLLDCFSNQGTFFVTE